MNKKILITGGAGYIGSLLTEKLLDNGFNITVIDTMMFKTNLLHLYGKKGKLNFICADVRDKTLLIEEVNKADIIIPLAGYVGVTMCDKYPRDAKEVNFEVVRFISEIKSNDQKIIFPNTNSGYGIKSGLEYCTEETPLEPISLYGRTKVQAEEALLQKSNTISLRLATVFGVSPRMRKDLLVNFYTISALKDNYIVVFDAGFKRNFVYVRDVADCFNFFCNDNKIINEVFNFGNDESNLTKMELALKVKEQVPKMAILTDENFSDPDKRNYIVSSQKLVNYGFKAEHLVIYGITEIINAYQMLENL